MKNQNKNRSDKHKKMHRRHAEVREHLHENIHEILTEEDTISKSDHKSGEQMLLLVRNGFALVAAILFFCSFFVEGHLVLRGIAYILGAVAYSSELLILTDFFTKRVPHNELFMIYCFGPLYILMGINYFLEAFF